MSSKVPTQAVRRSMLSVWERNLAPDVPVRQIVNINQASLKRLACSQVASVSD